METCFFQIHLAYGNEVGGNWKNEVLSNNMSVIWIFETVGAEKNEVWNEVKTRSKTSTHSFLVTIPSASPFFIIFEMAFHFLRQRGSLT